MKRTIRISFVCLCLVFSSLAWMCQSNDGPITAVIIQAAGYAPGEEAPEDPDAISQATSEGVNTYTLTDNLIKKLTAEGIQTKVIGLKEAKEMMPNARIVILAAPVYNGKLPEQFSPVMSNLTVNPKSVITCLMPCGTPESGAEAAKLISEQLAKAGHRVVDGLSIGNKSEADQIETVLADLTSRLIAEVKK